MKLRWCAWCAVSIAAVCVGAAEANLPADGKKVVSYRDFGAKGDGKTDDYTAIVKAHAYANQHNLPVRAEDGATYYIGEGEGNAVIQTDTDWGKAKFIIDDTLPLKNFRSPIFTVSSKLPAFTPKGITSLKKNQEKLDIKLPHDSLIVVYNDAVKRYVRYGSNANSGTPQVDLFLVDKNGKVNQDAPIIWDFDKITKIQAYPIDDKTLTVTGGHFTTLANKREGRHQYFGRGIRIARSNTVIDGVRHDVVEGGGIDSWPYTGFINVGDCAHVTVKNAVLTGRKLYSYPVPGSDKRKTTGTYDISAGRATHLSFINCKQSNDINDPTYWGIMGTNFCKKLLLDGCRISRFDAHQGVTNAVIRNSTLGYQGINAIGFGTFLIENTTNHCRNFVNLRSDYGSTWNGDFVIRNCIFAPIASWGTPAVFNGSNNGKHDFGYVCYMPTRIVVDGLKIDTAGVSKKAADVVFFANFNPQQKKNSPAEKYPYIVTKELDVKKLSTSDGKPVRLSANPEMFREVKVKGSGVQK